MTDRPISIRWISDVPSKMVKIVDYDSENRTHGGPCCQEGMANSPGDVACVAGLGGTVMWLFLVAAVLCRRAGRGQAGAPAAPRRQARARTNELEAGKRRPMMRSEEEPFPEVEVCTEVAGLVSRVWLVVGVVSHAPIRRLPGGGSP